MMNKNANSTKVKIGLFGVGHLGKFHLNCILLCDNLELVGFYEPSDKNAQLALDKGIKRYDDIDSLLAEVQAVDIVTPTFAHFEVAEKALKAGKHVFIEKPLTETVEQAEILLALAKEKKVKVQVGHVERFNPAMLAIREVPLNPMFIEAHRLAVFNPRGTDVSVVLDLMIHDLDIVLSLVPSKIKQISANGVSIVSTSPDIANARIEFENGCVANITASRISMKNMRKVRVFQRDAYISLDFMEKNAQIIRMYEDDLSNAPTENLIPIETYNGVKHLHMSSPKVEPGNAIQLELYSFAESILNDLPMKVDIQDGYEALKVAYQINKEINDRMAALAHNT
ncbi:MAG: Gfo/Idh/MocA family oxidoreductase [Saprospiraceae bacterium]